MHCPHGVGRHLDADRPGLDQVHDAQHPAAPLVELLDLLAVVLFDGHGELNAGGRAVSEP